jgi:hypothetical protein
MNMHIKTSVVERAPEGGREATRFQNAAMGLLGE